MFYKDLGFVNCKNALYARKQPYKIRATETALRYSAGIIFPPEGLKNKKQPQNK